MHFFGTLGLLMTLFGFACVSWLVGYKWYMLSIGKLPPLVSDQALFYVALTAMIIGVQLFTAGFVADLVSRNGADRNSYQIRDQVGL